MRPRLAVLPPRPLAGPRDPRREALARALSRCPARERVLLALLLFERLTPAEAADVLDQPAARIERSYAALLATLSRVVRSGAVQATRFAPDGGRLRRAS
jgi:DNA-directed RNA polymerase specialized sigma24 family protein